MKKMLKIMAMLLVIGAVVFAAGCSDKAETNTTDQGASEEVTNEGAVADENVSANNTSAEVPPAPADGNMTIVTNSDDNGSDDNGSISVVGSFDDNGSDDNGSDDNGSVLVVNGSANNSSL